MQGDGQLAGGSSLPNSPDCGVREMPRRLATGHFPCLVNYQSDAESTFVHFNACQIPAGFWLGRLRCDSRLSAYVATAHAFCLCEPC